MTYGARNAADSRAATRNYAARVDEPWRPRSLWWIGCLGRPLTSRLMRLR